MTNLNSILGRWQPDVIKAVPALDCQACMTKWKCCDFQPFWANFLIGAHIENHSDLDLIGPHHWQPIGLIPNHDFRQKHARTPTDQRGEDLVCGFFNKAQRECQIWEVRPGECSNYFCEGMGPELQKASQDAFHMETVLAQRALIQLGFDFPQVGAQIDLLNEPGGTFPKYSEAELVEIYRECWRWARNLEANEVREWL